MKTLTVITILTLGLSACAEGTYTRGGQDWRSIHQPAPQTPN